MQADGNVKSKKIPVKNDKVRPAHDLSHKVFTADPLCNQSDFFSMKSRAFVACVKKNQSPKVMLGLRGLSLQQWNAATLNTPKNHRYASAPSEIPCLLLWSKVSEAFQMLLADHRDRLASYLGVMMRSDMLEAFFKKASSEDQRHYLEVLRMFVFDCRIEPRMFSPPVRSAVNKRSDRPVFIKHVEIVHTLGSVLGCFAQAESFSYFIDLVSDDAFLKKAGIQSREMVLEMMNVALQGLFDERKASSSDRPIFSKKDRVAKEKAVSRWCQRQFIQDMDMDGLHCMLSLLYQHQAYHAFFLFYDDVARKVYASLHSPKSDQQCFHIGHLKGLTTTALNVGVYYRALLPSVMHALNGEYSRLTQWCRKADTVTADQTLAEYLRRGELIVVLEQWTLFLRRIIMHSWQHQTNALSAMIKQWVHLELLRFVFDDAFTVVDFTTSVLDVFPGDLEQRIISQRTCDVVTVFLDTSRALYQQTNSNASIGAKLRAAWSLMHVRLLRYGYDLALTAQHAAEFGLNTVADRICDFIVPNFSTCLYWTPAYRHQIEYYLFDLNREKNQALASDAFLFWHQFAQSQSRKLELMNQKARAHLQQAVQEKQLTDLSMLVDSVLGEDPSAEQPRAFTQDDPFVSSHSPVRGSYLLADKPTDSMVVPVSPAEASYRGDSGFLSAYREVSSLGDSGFWSAHRTPAESRASSRRGENPSFSNSDSFFRSVSSQMSLENDSEQVIVFNLSKSIW